MRLLCCWDAVAGSWVSLGGRAFGQRRMWSTPETGQWQHRRGEKLHSKRSSLVCWWGVRTSVTSINLPALCLTSLSYTQEPTLAFLRQQLPLSTKLHLNKDTRHSISEGKHGSKQGFCCMFSCYLTALFFYCSLLCYAPGHCNSWGCIVF